MVINQTQSAARRDQIMQCVTFRYTSRGKEGFYTLTVAGQDVANSKTTGTEQDQTLVDLFCCEVLAVSEQDPKAELVGGGQKVAAGELADKFWRVMVPREIQILPKEQADQRVK